MLIEIALSVWRISSNISGCTGPIFAIFSHHMKALYMPMMDLYFIFQFIKGYCHGNQIVLPHEGKLILRAFFAVRQMAARFRFATIC